jgi:hypothetical protein
VVKKVLRIFGAGLAVGGIVALSSIAFRLAHTGQVLPPRETVIRRPSVLPGNLVGRIGLRVSQNIALFATVTVSSVDDYDVQASKGVADGLPNTGEWITSRQREGAWIRLSWEYPVTVTEVELYDRLDPRENVLAGTLLFSDGLTLSVPALPPNGTAWRTVFRPRQINWLLFRIDRAEGTQTGLDEIMVYGTLNR